MGYFLEDDPCRQGDFSEIYAAQPEDALQQLLAITPEPEDQEYKLLLSLTCLRLAEKAAATGKTGYALRLLAQAEDACRDCVYQDLLRRQFLLLRYRLQPENAAALAPQLPELTEELMLLAQAALQQNDPQRCEMLLNCVQTQDPSWQYLRAEAFLAQQNYTAAAEHYLQCENLYPQKVYARLEQCYRELKDFEKAYFYACKQR